MENALRAKPLDVKEQYERQLKELQEVYGEAMLELRARKKLIGLQQKHRAADLPAQRLASEEAANRTSTKGESPAVSSYSPRSALGDGFMSYLGWTRWLGGVGTGD